MPPGAIVQRFIFIVPISCGRKEAELVRLARGGYRHVRCLFQASIQSGSNTIFGMAGDRLYLALLSGGVRGSLRSKMNSSFGDTFAKVSAETPKFFASPSFGVWCSQSVKRNVASSLKLPSSNPKEHAAVRTETLDGVWNASREQPEIAFVDVVDKTAAMLIHSGDTNRAINHVGPPSPKCLRFTDAPLISRICTPAIF